MAASPQEQLELFQRLGHDEVTAAAASVTGIIHGWTDRYGEGYRTFHLRCLRCRIGYCYDVAEEELYGAKFDIKQHVEQRIEYEFESELKRRERNCPHWVQYQLLRKS